MDAASRATAEAAPVVVAAADVDPTVNDVPSPAVSSSSSAAGKVTSAGKVSSVEAPSLVASGTSTPSGGNATVGKNVSPVKKTTSDAASPLSSASQPSSGDSEDKLFVVTARAADPAMGTVTVRTESLPTSTTTNRGVATASKGFPYGTVLSLEAKSRDGYRFVRWNDGSASARRRVTVTANAEYVATFEKVSGLGLSDDDPAAGGPGAEAGVSGTATGASAAKQKGIMPLLRKWWWAILILALMIYDMKGGK